MQSAAHLSDTDLLAEVTRLAHCEQEATARLVAHLAELDARRLYLGAGFSSLFGYCCEVLHFSEHETYNRIEAARVARRFPIVLDLLAAGALHLTAVRLLAPHLTNENHRELLVSATHRSKREVEEQVARQFPRPDVVSSVRKLPPHTAEAFRAKGTVPSLAWSEGIRASPFDGAAGHSGPVAPPTAGSAVAPPTVGFAVAPPNAGSTTARERLLAPAPLSASAPAAPPSLRETLPSPTLQSPSAVGVPASRRPAVSPLAPDRYEIRFTVSTRTRDKLRLAQDLLRHSDATGDPAEVFDRALTLLLDDLARRKLAASARPSRLPRPALERSRHIPAHVRRTVWVRDGGRCAFESKAGRRCGERGFLEFHHVTPFGMGGPTTAGNISLRCRAHNAHEADLFYGPRSLARE